MRQLARVHEDSCRDVDAHEASLEKRLLAPTTPGSCESQYFIQESFIHSLGLFTNEMLFLAVSSLV